MDDVVTSRFLSDRLTNTDKKYLTRTGTEMRQRIDSDSNPKSWHSTNDFRNSELGMALKCSHSFTYGTFAI